MVLSNIFNDDILTVLINFNSNIKEFLRIKIDTPIFNWVYIATFIWWIIKKNPTGFEITSLSILIKLIIQFYLRE